MATERHPLKVVFVGQFPPPVNGLTFITSRLAAALVKAGHDVAVANTTGPAGRRSLGFHAVRALRIIHALLLMTSNARLGRPRVCYFTAEGGLGLVYSVMIACWARLFRFRIYVHHHSFSYIVRRRTLMNLLLAWSGADAVHICLSVEMAQDLANRYGRAIKTIVLSNAAFVDASAFEPSPRKRRELTIGLLSNLTADKGLYEFVEILRLARQRALPIRGLLAGPVASAADKTALETSREELGDYLDYLGPLYDSAKAEFFKDIDVFVFLTTYLNEAQPTVLFEAMANGVPVISCDRGCITSQVASGGCVFPQGADVVSEALNVLEGFQQDPDLLVSQKRAALNHFSDEQHRALEQVASLFETTPVLIAAS
jgi:glycosyltransferase involved in cell wall biosynthesis